MPIDSGPDIVLTCQKEICVKGLLTYWNYYCRVLARGWSGVCRRQDMAQKVCWESQGFV